MSSIQLDIINIKEKNMTEKEKQLEEQLREMNIKFINLKAKAEDLIADLNQAETIRLKLVKQLKWKRFEDENN